MHSKISWICASRAWLWLAASTLFGLYVSVGCGPNYCDALEPACQQCSNISAKTICENAVVDGDDDTCQRVAETFERCGCHSNVCEPSR